MHLKHATFVAQRAEEDKTEKKWIKTAQDQEKVDRWIKTQDCKIKKWIAGSRLTTTTGQSFHLCVTIIYVKKYIV